MARPSPSCAHDDDRLHFSPASPPSSNSSEKKESTGPRLSQLCPPCATPSSSSSLDYRRSDARIVENGFAERSVVSKSAKVVLVKHSTPGWETAALRDFCPALSALGQSRRKRSGLVVGLCPLFPKSGHAPRITPAPSDISP